VRFLTTLSLLVAMIFALTCGTAAASTYPQGTEDFAVFGQPVDTSMDNQLGSCPEGYAWDGPKPDSPCFAPMAGNSRIVTLDDGSKVAVAPIGRWVCISYGSIQLCRTIKQALVGKMAFYDKTPSSGPGPYRIRIVQLVPDWVKTVTVYGKTYRAKNSLIVSDLSEQDAIAYQAYANNGKLADQFSSALPPDARKLRIFRIPLSHPRSLTTDEQAVISRYLSESWIGAIPSQARRFGGSDWVAVPGRFGMAITNLANISAPGFPLGVANDGLGTYYASAAEGDYLNAGVRCGGAPPSSDCPADGSQLVDFFQLLPDGVNSERIRGDLYVGVDGLVWGTLELPAGADPLADIDANIQHWKKQRRSHARRHR
jgi:hypothetical protein